MKRRKPETGSESGPEGAQEPPRAPDVAPASDGVPFEESFAVVEAAVERLESGDLPLEESLREYERGLASLGRCYEVLRKAQKRIEVLGSSVGSVVDGASGPEWKPGATHSALRETIDAVERADDVPENP